MHIELFDGTKKEIDSVNGQQQQNIDKVFDGLTPGTYYVMTERWYSENNTALHTLRVSAQ